MKVSGLTVVLVTVWSLAVPAFAAGTDAVTNQLRMVLEDLTGKGALAAVLALEGGGLDRLAVVAGHEDLDRTTPVTPDHAFQIGSQTKTFVAVAVLMLVRDGKLALTDPVANHVPGLPGDADITVGQLLNHTSGMGDGVAVLDEGSAVPSLPLDFEDLLLLSRIMGRQFEAGTAFRYNNFAYDVLGVLIERVSGERYDRYITRRILEPLGMNATFFASFEPWPEARLAHGYAYDDNAGNVIDATGPRDLSWASSAGDMISTTGDMMVWVDALSRSDNALGLGLTDLAAETVPVPGGGDMTHYGSGVMVRNFSGVDTLGHGGNIHGFVSYSGIVPGTDLRFSLMVSRDGKDVSAPAIMGAVSQIVGVALHLGLAAKGGSYENGAEARSRGE
ncbi:MAG: serine hydrolase domain-containing protein [Sphingomonadales bacterium]